MQLRKFLHAKIHQARVTQLEPEYEGSISIDKKLLEACGMVVGEEILVADIETGTRFVTYILEAPEDSGTIGVNGAAANTNIMLQDRLIIMAFTYCELKNKPEPNIVICDKNNCLVK